MSILRSWVTPVSGGLDRGTGTGQGGSSLSFTQGLSTSGTSSISSSFPSAAASLWRCGAHLIVLLRMVLPEDLLVVHQDWLHTTGDLILYK